MIVVVGLGNPGEKFANTKHNIGFITVDMLAERHGIRVSKLKHKAYIGEGFIAGKKVMLVKPRTFMNDSGQSVRQVLEYFDVPVSDLYVIYDDVDIALGALRIREKGSAGSHNGMKSIIYQLEDDEFPRFRIGIGAERGEVPLRNYVLSGFEADDLDAMRAAVVRCADAVEVALCEGVGAAMMKYNAAPKTDEEKGDE